MENEEEWRDIPGFEGAYQASRDGRIRSVEKEVVRVFKVPGRILKGHKGRNGYVQFCLYRSDGTKGGFLGHRLVCSAFHGPAPDDQPHVAHGDGTRDNNEAANLRWANPMENQADRVRHGTALRGRDVWHLSKLNPEDVVEIRNRAANGEPHSEIAARFGLHKASISNITRRKCWKHIA